MASGRQQVQVRYVDADARNRLRAVFENLEADLKIDGIGVVLTTAVLELVENAVKANLKRAFFSKNTYNFEDPTSYTAGI